MMKPASSNTVKELERRLAHYEKAIAMSRGKIPTDNSFQWPFYPTQLPKDPRNIMYWNGCIAELKYLIDYLKKSEASKPGKTGCKLPLTATSTGIRVPGKISTWRVINVTRGYKGEYLFLLESELYGSETSYIVVDEMAQPVMNMIHLFMLD